MMGGDSANLSMTLHSAPTEQDYQHAFRAHSAWAQLPHGKGRMTSMVIYWMIVFLIAGAVVVFLRSRDLGIRPWSMNPVWVIALVGFIPLLPGDPANHHALSQ